MTENPFVVAARKLKKIEEAGKAVMKLKTITYEGRECKAVRSDFYVKRGEYSHGWIKSWELHDAETGTVVVSGKPWMARAAYDFVKPKYATKKELYVSCKLIEDF